MTTVKELVSKAKTPRKPINEDLLWEELVVAKGQGMSMTAFIKQFSQANDCRENSVTQKIYKLRSHLKDLIKTDPSKKEAVEDVLNQIQLADGRKGAKGSGRKKIDRLSLIKVSLDEIKAKLGIQKTPKTPQVTVAENGDTVIQTDGQKITVHTENVSE